METVAAGCSKPAEAPLQEKRVAAASLTDFGQAVAAVPQLAQTCSSVLGPDIPGSGLKLMRLVSRQLSSMLLATVSGYTLRLDGGAQGISQAEVAVLAGTKLSHLRVIVSREEACELLSTA